MSHALIFALLVLGIGVAGLCLPIMGFRRRKLVGLFAGLVSLGFLECGLVPLGIVVLAMLEGTLHFDSHEFRYLILLSGGGLIAFAFSLNHTLKTKIPKGHCPKCLYDCKGLESCPECGHASQNG